MARKKKVGAPAFYDDPLEMQKRIDKYFEVACQPEFFLNKDGEPMLDKFEKPVIKNLNPPTVSGMALYLGFADRQSLYDYRAKKEFAVTIKKAITRIEQYAETQIFTKDKPTGAIFWLKNHRWSDKSKDDDSDVDKKKKEINEHIKSLADLISSPQPDRDIKDYE